MAETKVVLCLPVGGGRAGRPRKHMPGHSGALSAQRFSLTCEWSSPRGEGGKPLWDPSGGKATKSVRSPKTQSLRPRWVCQILKGSIWGLESFSKRPISGIQFTKRAFCCPVPTRKGSLRSPGLRFLSQAGRELGRNPKFSVKAKQHGGGEIQGRRAWGGGRQPLDLFSACHLWLQTAIHAVRTFPASNKLPGTSGFLLPGLPLTSS